MKREDMKIIILNRRPCVCDETKQNLSHTKFNDRKIHTWRSEPRAHTKQLYKRIFHCFAYLYCCCCHRRTAAATAIDEFVSIFIWSMLFYSYSSFSFTGPRTRACISIFLFVCLFNRNTHMQWFIVNAFFIFILMQRTLFSINVCFHCKWEKNGTDVWPEIAALLSSFPYWFQVELVEKYKCKLQASVWSVSRKSANFSLFFAEQNKSYEMINWNTH